jgi:hypothetical protein
LFCVVHDATAAKLKLSSYRAKPSVSNCLHNKQSTAGDRQTSFSCFCYKRSCNARSTS